VADVKELGHDHAALGFDELPGAGDLPLVGGDDILEATAPDSTIERERSHR
jgi:hypothetical protein